MKFCFAFICFFFCLAAFSQTDTTQTDLSATNRYFRWVYDNDLFRETDRYYSKGEMLEIVAPVFKKSPFSYALLPLKNSQNYYGLSIQHDVFTPINIEPDTSNKFERPYAATFVIRHSLVSIDSQKKMRLSSKLETGIIGSWALGEEVQTFVHKLVNSALPLGWENQINNDLVLNYNVAFEKALLSKKYFETIPFAEARAGTLNNDVALGLYLRAGLMNSYFAHYGLIKNSPKKFQIYLMARAQAKFVAYNATLQGGFFSNSIYTIPSKNVNRMVYSANLSLVLAFRGISIEYLNNYLTQEFKTGVDHGWGSLRLTFCF